MKELLSYLSVEDEQIIQMAKDTMIFWMRMTSVEVNKSELKSKIVFLHFLIDFHYLKENMGNII